MGILKHNILEEYNSMSSFSNGNYVPSGMDFSDWVEYLEEKRDAEKFALIDKEFEESFGEFLDS